MSGIELRYTEISTNSDDEWTNRFSFDEITVSRGRIKAKLVSPAQEDIKRLLQYMDIRKESTLTILLPDSKNISVWSAEQNRVCVKFRKGGGEILIIDPKMEDNYAEVELADPALEPLPIISRPQSCE